MISSSFTRHESIFCLQKLIPRRVNRNNNNNLHPRKNDKRPNHAVSILSNKKEHTLCASKHPADLPKQPKDLASFKISPPDGVDNEPPNISVAKPPTPSKDTLQRVVCDCRTRGEARAFGNTLLKLLENDFHCVGCSGVCW